MKTFLFLLALPVLAQVQQAVIVIPGAPPGGIGAACTAPALFYGNLTTGVIAGCVSSVWTALGGGGGTGDFVGPASATDNAAVRFNGTTGKLGQNSLFIIDDSGNAGTPGTLSTGVGGAVAGSVGLGQGTAASIVANTATFYAPTSVTGYSARVPGAAGTGVTYGINTANDIVQSFLAVTNCIDTAGQHLNFTAATPAFSCGTSGSGGGTSPFSTTTLSGSDNFGNWFAFGTILASQLGWNYANFTPIIGSTTTGTGVTITDTGIGIDAYIATAATISPTLWATAKRMGVIEGADNLNANAYHFGIGRAANVGAPCVRSCAAIQYTQGTDTNWRFISCDDAFNCTNRDTGTPFVAATKFRMYLRAGTAGTVFACADDATTDSVIGNTCNVAEVNITGSTLSSIAGPIEFGVHQGSITAATIIAWFAGFLNNPGF